MRELETGVLAVGTVVAVWVMAWSLGQRMKDLELTSRLWQRNKSE